MNNQTGTLFVLRKIKMNSILLFYRIEFSQLAIATKSLNLGQGFPDYDPPSRFSNFLAEVASEKNSFFNQYTRGFVIL